MTTAENKRRTPTQARAARTRSALLEAARAEFSERGYTQTTSRSITQRAGLAAGSFYQYFNDKDEVLLELYGQRSQKLLEQALARLSVMQEVDFSKAEVSRQALGEFVDLVIDLHRDDPGFHAVLTEREHADERVRQRTQRHYGMFVELTAGLLTRLKYQGDVRARAFTIVGLVEGSVHAHVLGSPVVDDARFRDDLVNALLLLAQPPTA